MPDFSVPIKSLLRRAVGIMIHRLKKKHPLQKQKFKELPPNLIRLGSEYGGWSFLDDPASLRNSIIVSAGLGEDASFDIEFANKYDAKVLVVDPTPRAIIHFDSINQHIGSPRNQQYVKGGVQPIDAYDLEGIKNDQLILENKALWHAVDRLKFFKPVNPSHVSHSIINFQNRYQQDTDYIEVESLPLDVLLEKHKIQKTDVAMVKFDIEGAEIEVITDMLEKQILPRQVCVEFDELNKPSKKAFARVSQAHNALLNSGYQCVYGEQGCNFLYVR